MCRRVTCSKCGKATYAGCGNHVEQVLAGVPKSRRCDCPAEPGAPGGPSAAAEHAAHPLPGLPGLPGIHSAIPDRSGKVPLGVL